MEYNKSYMKIGQFAERAGLTPRTIRYYEEIGLFESQTRTEGDMRLYSDLDLDAIRNIQEMKELLGFQLQEIKQIIETERIVKQIKEKYIDTLLVSERVALLQTAQEITRKQLTLIHEKISRLHQLEEKKQTLLNRIEEKLNDLST